MKKIAWVCHGPLGDELHICRNCLLDLLYQNIISNDSIIVTNEDRKFLYENIFKTVLNYDEWENVSTIYKNNPDFIVIDDWCNPINGIIRNSGQAFHNLEKSIKPIILKRHEHLNYDNIQVSLENNRLNYNKINFYNNNHSEEFTNLVLNIKYLKKLPKFNDEHFIVIHYRDKGNNEWDNNFTEIDNFIKMFQGIINIVIFSGNNDSLKKIKNRSNFSDIYYTSNLQEYASFMNSEKCKLIISTWSGGGQFASYCSNYAKIILYLYPVHSTYELLIKEKNLDLYINNENGYDYCHFVRSKRYFILDTQLKDVKKYL